MTTETKVARRKLSLLELAAEMSNVSKACKIMGYSRQQFYEIRRNYQTFGSEGLSTDYLVPKVLIRLASPSVTFNLEFATVTLSLCHDYPPVAVVAASWTVHNTGGDSHPPHPFGG